MRLLALPDPAPDLNDDSDNQFYGYLERPARDFPSDKAFCVRWVYVVNLDNETFSVGIPDLVRRIFQLRHVIRSLFDPNPTPTGEISEFDDYRVLLDVVPRSCLAGSSVQMKPDQGLIELYHSYEPQIKPLPSVAEPATLPVRKYLRLCLTEIFCHGHHTALKGIYASQVMRDNHPERSEGSAGSSDPHFRQIIFGIINLFSSGSEVEFKADNRYKSTTEWEGKRYRDERAPLMWPVPPAEYWIGDILIVPEAAMPAAEILYAGIGTAVQIIHARNSAFTTASDSSQPTTRALIISLTSLVVVDVQGDKLTQTPNISLLARYDRRTDGILALLDILYTPPPTPIPQFFPVLPVEICQSIFRYATADTRRSLRATGRLFHGIAYDYGPRISAWNLQTVTQITSGYADIAAADPGVHIRGGKVRRFLARRREVIISAEMGQCRPIYRVVLRRPDGGTIELQLPLVGIAIHKSMQL